MFRGLKAKGLARSLQKYFRQSFVFIIWLKVDSVSRIITIETIFSRNFVFIKRPVRSLKKCLKQSFVVIIFD